jgi:hypothetical protein
MYPEKDIFDVGGFPVIKGRDLVVNLVEQAAPFPPRYLLGVRAEKLSYRDGAPVLHLADGTDIGCGAVIVTGGLAASPRARFRRRQGSRARGHRLLRAAAERPGRSRRRHRRRRRLGVRLGAALADRSRSP